MKRLLSFYQYLAPLVLAPASFVLWQRASGGQPQVIAIAWGLPILWAYILPGLGTNVFKVWEFDVRLKLGRFRPQHGFVFGSATAMIAWLVHADTIGGGFDLSVGSTAALSGCVAAMVMLEAGIAAGVVAGVLVGALVGLGLSGRHARTHPAKDQYRSRGHTQTAGNRQAHGCRRCGIRSQHHPANPRNDQSGSREVGEGGGGREDAQDLGGMGARWRVLGMPWIPAPASVTPVFN